MTVLELKERYIYAATRRLPSKTRQDIAKELDTLVDDMLLERCGDTSPTEKDMRVIIAEIGQPSEIHRKYSPMADMSLIAPPYYEPYMLVIKIVAACVFFGITVAYVISMATNATTPVSTIFLWLGSLGGSFSIAFTFITILFMFFSHKGISLNDFDNEINNLQPVPKTNTRISKGESIFSIVMCIVFAIVFIALPNMICVVIDGKFIPIFNSEALRSAWVWIILCSGIGIFRECVALIDGKCTKRLLFTTIVTDFAVLICAAMIFLQKSFLNANLFTEIFAGDLSQNIFLTTVLNNANLFILGIIVFSTVIDIASILWKYYNAEK